MRTTSRLAVSAAVLGGGLLLAAPASAQEVCDYPFDCAPTGGGSGAPATGGGSGAPGSGTKTVVNNSPAVGASNALPFTGGQVTLIALAGADALGGGVVLVAAGRKRATV